MLLAVTWGASTPADTARFFRITGPVPATITGFTADGYLTWTNLPTNATFTVQSTPSLLTQSNALMSSNWSDYVQIPATNAVTRQRLIDPHPPANMALIPAGSFTMGDSSDGSSFALPLHPVQLSAFYMDRYDVTKALWDEVYNWATSHGYSFDYGADGKAANHPVQNVDWYDAVKWCNARSEKEGRRPAYYTEAGQKQVYRSGQTDVQNGWVRWTSGYRLPTEAEWEAAARGGATGQRFPWGNMISWNQANHYSYWANGQSYYTYDSDATGGYHPAFAAGAAPYTSPVGYFAPNGYGLYDMAGNVWQWCWDWYDAYPSGAQSGPCGPATGTSRVLRGGGWGSVCKCCASANRVSTTPSDRGYSCGFRAVLPPNQ